MKNLDALKKQKAEVMNRLVQAIKDGNEEAFQQAFDDYTTVLEEAVLAEAKGLVKASDNQILAGRGVRVLTSEERDYYQKLVDAMRSGNPKQALTNFGVVLPETIINAVFEDIKEEHPLLSEIRFENAGALIKYLYSSLDGRHLAFWGPLCGTITKELAASFAFLDMEQTKLSAWLPVCKAMLDLGPEWLDRYVRSMLAEGIANGLENGIINGRGMATAAADPADRIYEPVGMIRDLDTYDQVTGYAAKVAVPVADFSPEVYGPIIAQLAVNRNNLYRRVTSVLLVVNPVDYFTKVMPATTYRNPDGTYNLDLFPFPTKVVQSAWLDPGAAVIGLGKRYLMAMGTGKGGRIEYSDEYKFLEDERTYLTKFYGTGRPMDNTSFLVLDIQGLVPVVPNVYVTNDPLNVAGSVGITGQPIQVGIDGQPIETTGFLDARLSSLKIGALALTPAFNKSVMVYTAATADATNTITAVAKDGDSTISIKVNGVAHTNGTAATWEAGENTVEITVLNVIETETYTVTVTKS